MKRMRYYIAVPIFLLAFLLQTTLLAKVSVFGVAPNLLLCFVIVFSFLYETYYGLVLGVIFGALLDVAVSWLFGVQTITFVLTYAIVYMFRGIFNHEKVLPDLLMAVIATPINSFFVWGIYRLAGSPVHVRYVLYTLPPLIVMHCILVALLHLIFVRSVIRHRRDRSFERRLYL